VLGNSVPSPDSKLIDSVSLWHLSHLLVDVHNFSACESHHHIAENFPLAKQLSGKTDEKSTLARKLLFEIGLAQGS